MIFMMTGESHSSLLRRNILCLILLNKRGECRWDIFEKAKLQMSNMILLLFLFNMNVFWDLEFFTFYLFIYLFIHLFILLCRSFQVWCSPVCLYFAFVACAFDDMSKKLLPRAMPWIFPLSSSNFTISIIPLSTISPYLSQVLISS